MDNNNLPPQPAAPVANTPPARNASASAAGGPASGPAVVEPARTSNKLTIWFIVGLVLVVALVGGIYFYLSRQAANPEAPVSQKPVVQVTPTPPDTMDALERDLNSINEASAGSDFTSVDSDLQQL